MDAFKVVCFVFALVGALAAVSDAIKCYQCESVTTANCKDDFNKEGITVNKNCAQCMKTKAVVNGKQIVGRACSPVKIGENECKEEKKSGAEGSMCGCDTDLCNGTPHVTVTVFTLVTAVLIALKFM